MEKPGSMQMFRAFSLCASRLYLNLVCIRTSEVTGVRDQAFLVFGKSTFLGGSSSAWVL